MVKKDSKPSNGERNALIIANKSKKTAKSVNNRKSNSNTGISITPVEVTENLIKTKINQSFDSNNCLNRTLKALINKNFIENNKHIVYKSKSNVLLLKLFLNICEYI